MFSDTHTCRNSAARVVIVGSFLVCRSLLLLSGCATTGTTVFGRATARHLLEGDAKAGSAELREIGAKYPILRRYISDYGKLQDAIGLLHKRRTK